MYNNFKINNFEIKDNGQIIIQSVTGNNNTALIINEGWINALNAQGNIFSSGVISGNNGEFNVIKLNDNYSISGDNNNLYFKNLENNLINIIGNNINPLSLSANQVLVSNANGVIGAIPNLWFNGFTLTIGDGIQQLATTIALSAGSGASQVIRWRENNIEYGSVYHLTNTNDFVIRATASNGSLIFMSGGSNQRLKITNNGEFIFSKSNVYFSAPRTQFHFYDIVENGDVGITIGNAGNYVNTVPTVSIGFRTRDIEQDIGESAKIICGRDGNYSVASNRNANLQFHVEIADTLTEIMRLNSNKNIVLSEGVNISTGTNTGTKIGNNASEKIGFYGATPVTQPNNISEPSGGSVVDSEARIAINAIINRLRTLGLIAS